MSKVDRTEHIRQLLNHYYSGLATPEDVGVISDFFNKSDIDSLPGDLRTDALIFKEIASDKALTPVPAALESRLEDFIDSLPEKADTRRRGYIMRLALSGAAAVALVVGLGIALIGSHSDKTDSHGVFAEQTMTEELKRAPEFIDTVDKTELIAAPLVDEAVAQVETKEPESAVQQTVKVVEVKEISKSAEDGDFRYARAKEFEVTDPETASRLTAQVFGMLGRTIGMAGDALVKTDKKTEIVPQTINKILKYEYKK